MDASITNATAQSSLCTEQESGDAVCRIQAMEMKAQGGRGRRFDSRSWRSWIGTRRIGGAAR
jgi:hypothetical protein